MSAPRTKRQFAGAASDPAQRQITSFFLSNNNNNNSNNNTTTAAAGNSGCVNNDQASQISSTAARRLDGSSSYNIPASVQANLLSVGMRVRKSVPEGYKTGSYSAFALWDESDAEAITAAMGEGQRSRANAFSSPRELLPFCGIHRVGGLGTQPDDGRPTPTMPTGFGFGGGAYSNYDDVPGLTYSQESLESEASPGARARKRLFVEDEEDDLTAQLNIWRHNDHNSNNNSSDSNNSNNYNGGRAMAVPSKGRLRAKFSGATAMPTGGQENLMAVDNDFEEAQFLDRGPWEVDMHDA